MIPAGAASRSHDLGKQPAQVAEQALPEGIGQHRHPGGERHLPGPRPLPVVERAMNIVSSTATGSTP